MHSVLLILWSVQGLGWGSKEMSRSEAVLLRARVLKQSLIKPSQEWELHTQAWGGLEDKAIFIFLTVLANPNVQMDNVW